MTKELKQLIPVKKTEGHVFRNLLFLFLISAIILFDAFVFAGYSTWSAPLHHPIDQVLIFQLV